MLQLLHAGVRIVDEEGHVEYRRARFGGAGHCVSIYGSPPDALPPSTGLTVSRRWNASASVT